jgi:pimeloyl-ACP methyl ester carboxylesterase
LEKALTINQDGYSIRCTLYSASPRSADTLVLYGQGFGGSRDSGAVRRFAQKLLAKHKDAALLAFDWPCHGDDGRKSLLLSDCDAYLNQVILYGQKRFQPRQLWAMATSFGGYVFLRHLTREGNPFQRLALRCPAVNFPALLEQEILTPLSLSKLHSGKTVLWGFERKMKLTSQFLEELREGDVEQADFRPFASQLLVLHGSKDRVISPERTRDFAQRNGIGYQLIENADHGFIDPQRLDLAIAAELAFFAAE